MTNLVYIAAGGAAGALCRHWAGSGVQAIMGSSFPYGTLIVNVSGCLVMGYLYVMLIERMDMGTEWRAALLIGFLGAYTTFSSFSMETLKLIETGEQLRAGLNVFLSMTLCLLACWAGLLIGRKV